MREKYYRSLADLAFKLEYIGVLTQRNNKWIMYMNIILGLASSSAIGGLLIFQGQFYIIWAIIIAASQIIIAIRPSLPFDKRKDSLHKLDVELSFVLNSMSRLWFSIDQNKVADHKIFEHICDFDLDINRAIFRCLGDEKFDHKDIKKIANDRTDQYLNNKFGGDAE